MTAKMIATISSCSSQDFSFFVSGKPETQGSKSAFGRIYTDKSGKQRVAVAMAEQSKGLHAWRSSIGKVALVMRPSSWETCGIFVLSVIFYMPRPKAHFKSNGDLRDNAPLFHSKLGDADKLLRACGDALTGICYDDDSLIVAASSIKMYCNSADGPGAHISVTRLDVNGASTMAAALSP